MTDLLSPLTRRRSADAADAEGGRRPLALSAAVAAVAAPLTVLLGLWVVGLVGWYAADGGSHGTTRSVLRVAADGWLLAHDAHLALVGATVTASPLGLTLVCVLVTYRWGRWAGASSAGGDLHAVGLAAVVVSGVYGVLALLTSLLASSAGAQPGLGLAFVGGALVGGLAGGAGLLRGAGQASALRRSLPVHALSVGYAALVTVGAMVAAGAVLAAVSLALNLPAAARITDQLALEVIDGVLSLLLLGFLLPNVSLMGASYLLGPGFAVGAGTAVSPGEVSLGPMPTLPVLAALPPDGWAPGWAMAFLAVPVLLAAVAAAAVGRVLPSRAYPVGAARGLGAGVLAGVLLGIAVSYAGGAIGPGRMSEVGAGAWAVGSAGVLSLGLGGSLGGILATWWTRRRGLAEAVHPAPEPAPAPGPDDLTGPVPVVPSPRAADLSTEDTVQVRLPPGRPVPPSR